MLARRKVTTGGTETAAGRSRYLGSASCDPRLASLSVSLFSSPSLLLRPIFSSVRLTNIITMYSLTTLPLTTPATTSLPLPPVPSRSLPLQRFGSLRLLRLSNSHLLQLRRRQHRPRLHHRPRPLFSRGTSVRSFPPRRQGSLHGSRGEGPLPVVLLQGNRPAQPHPPHRPVRDNQRQRRVVPRRLARCHRVLLR